MNVPNMDALGNQVISYEVAITSILQVLAYAQPVVGQAIAQAMRDNSKMIPSSFQGVRERVDQYVALIETQLAKQTQ